jgi:hypothetical protein
MLTLFDKKKLFLQKYNMGNKNAELDADFDSVEKTVKKSIQKSYQQKFAGNMPFFTFTHVRSFALLITFLCEFS